ncbi:MAG: hypothetical protein GXP27_22515 [Planctomycetes bacterium]|nr:hypothetical protein [Planctomycetota bacterium]
MRSRVAIPVFVLLALLISAGSLNPIRPVSLDRGWWADGESANVSSVSVAAPDLEARQWGLPVPPSELAAVFATISPPVAVAVKRLGTTANAAEARFDRWRLPDRRRWAWVAAPAPPPENERPKKRERWPDGKAILTEPPRPQPETRREAEEPATTVGTGRRERGERQLAEFRSRPEAALAGAGRMMACDRNVASDVIHPDGRRPNATGRQGWT